jgi:sulfur transfer complex TusBCD TusB component (DsrH family)
MRILHLIRRADDQLALEVAGQGGPHDTIVLIQDGVRAAVAGTAGAIYASADDARARGLRSDYPLLDPPQIAQKILEHERMIVW